MHGNGRRASSGRACGNFWGELCVGDARRRAASRRRLPERVLAGGGGGGAAAQAPSALDGWGAEQATRAAGDPAHPAASDVAQRRYCAAARRRRRRDVSGWPAAAGRAGRAESSAAVEHRFRPPRPLAHGWKGPSRWQCTALGTQSFRPWACCLLPRPPSAKTVVRQRGWTTRCCLRAALRRRRPYRPAKAIRQASQEPTFSDTVFCSAAARACVQAESKLKMNTRRELVMRPLFLVHRRAVRRPIPPPPTAAIPAKKSFTHAHDTGKHKRTKEGGDGGGEEAQALLLGAPLRAPSPRDARRRRRPPARQAPPHFMWI